jgi:hypothetical protein
MREHLEATFAFGSVGNFPVAQNEGWSVEDGYAWAVGAESRLRLTLPNPEMPHILRLTLQPLVNAGVLDAQRLTVETEAGPLASFSIDRRTTIDLDLPPGEVHDDGRITLILRHPDALRPCDFTKSKDTRRLSLCFLSGSLLRQIDDVFEHPPGSATLSHGPLSHVPLSHGPLSHGPLSHGPLSHVPLCHVIIAGGDLAREITSIMAALPALHDRVACHFVNTDQDPGGMPPPAEALQSAALCWEQSGGNASAEWATQRQMLPDDCEIRRFAAPHLTALWPFLGPDPRLKFEPRLYPGGRYAFGDRIAANLASLQLPDDVMQLSYLSMTEKEMPDLDGLLAADRAAWRKLDATNDVKLAEFIVENFRRYRLFFAPPHPTGELLRHMIVQLVADSPLEAFCNPPALRRELDFLLTGYLGRRQELPIHPHVARRFGLAWWQPGMRYRWRSNRWTFEEHALRTIRWTPWRP